MTEMNRNTEMSVTLYARVPKDLKRQLEYESWRQGRNMQDLVAQALMEYFSRLPEKGLSTT